MYKILNRKLSSLSSSLLSFFSLLFYFLTLISVAVSHCHFLTHVLLSDHLCLLISLCICVHGSGRREATCVDLRHVYVGFDFFFKLLHLRRHDSNKKTVKKIQQTT